MKRLGPSSKVSATSEWAPVPLLYHGGSNTMNLAHIWVEPRRDFAMVMVTNISVPRTNTALMTLAAQLYKAFAPPS